MISCNFLFCLPRSSSVKTSHAVIVMQCEKHSHPNSKLENVEKCALIFKSTSFFFLHYIFQFLIFFCGKANTEVQFFFFKKSSS